MKTPEELSFFLTYPAPGAAPLRFEMSVLDRLEDGNQVTLVVLDAKRKPLGGGILQRGAASLAVAPEKLADSVAPIPTPTPAR